MRLRPLIGFVVRIGLLYVLMAWPWSIVGQAYASAYRGVCNACFSSLASGGSVHFQPISEPKRDYDSEIRFVNTRTGAKQLALTSSRDPAYYQTAFVIALVLATPLLWRRRLLALAASLVLVHMVILGKVFITLVHGLNREQVAVLHLSSGLERLVTLANREVVNDIVSLLMIPVVIWIVVMFFAGDWERWLGDVDEPVTSGETPTATV